MTGSALRRLRADGRGNVAIEFALIAPVFLALLFGIVQLCRLFLANAGLHNAVEDAARYATIWPRPTEAQITSRIANGRFGLEAANIIGPTVSFNTSATPKYVVITMGYRLRISYVIGEKSIDLTQSRQAYVNN